MFSIMSCMPIKADTLPCEIINMESLPDNQDATYDADANMEYIKSVCAKYDLDVSLVLAVIETESHFKLNATSSAGCVGLMQISPRWHENRCTKLGLSTADLYDGNSNILVGCDYLRQLLDTYKDTALSLMVYNQGEKSAMETYQTSGVSEYADKVLSAQEKYR